MRGVGIDWEAQRGISGGYGDIPYLHLGGV